MKKKTKYENKTKEINPSFWGFIWNKMWWWIPIFILAKIGGLDAEMHLGWCILMLGVFIFWRFKYKKLKKQKD